MNRGSEPGGNGTSGRADNPRRMEGAEERQATDVSWRSTRVEIIRFSSVRKGAEGTGASRGPRATSAVRFTDP